MEAASPEPARRGSPWIGLAVVGPLLPVMALGHHLGARQLLGSVPVWVSLVALAVWCALPVGPAFRHRRAGVPRPPASA